MTRIALVASSYLPRLGGVEEHVFHLARELRDRGHDVSIWTAERGDPVEDRVAGVRYLSTPLPNRSVIGVLSWFVRAPRAAWQWWRALRHDRPELIDVQCFGSNGPWALLLARVAGIPLVYSNHGETFMDADRTFEVSALMRAALRRTLSRAVAVTSCSRYAAADLERFGAVAEAVVTGNGVDLEIDVAEPVADLPDRYIAGVGRQVAVKGFDRLVEAFAEGESLDGVDLVLAGDGPERGELERLARDRGVGPRVRFTGALSRAQVRAVLDRAMMQVVPSLEEAFGIVVLEGWRSGTPVLATSRGGVPEFLTDEVDGVLFDPDDTSALSARLVALTRDPGRRARLGAAGRASVARHTWAVVADAYERVFADALAESRTAGPGA